MKPGNGRWLTIGPVRDPECYDPVRLAKLPHVIRYALAVMEFGSDDYSEAEFRRRYIELMSVLDESFGNWQGQRADVARAFKILMVWMQGKKQEFDAAQEYSTAKHSIAIGAHVVPPA